MPLKMLHKTSNVKMAVCKAAVEGATKILEEHLWIILFFVKLWISSLQLKNSELRHRCFSKILIKDF